MFFFFFLSENLSHVPGPLVTFQLSVTSNRSAVGEIYTDSTFIHPLTVFHQSNDHFTNKFDEQKLNEKKTSVT